MTNYIWSFLLVVGIVISIIKGDSSLTNNILNGGSSAINIVIGMIPIMCLWLGIMKIAEQSGLTDILSKKLSRYIHILFPDIPKSDAANTYISSNIIMNMLGLGNAATPFGLKAIKELKRLNGDSDVASRSMITFLVINTCSVTIIPTTVISLRVMNGSTNASEIVTATIITSFISLFFALILDRIFYFFSRRSL